MRGIVVPAENANEAAVVEKIEVIPVATLAQGVGFFSGDIDIASHPRRLDELVEQNHSATKRTNIAG